MHPGHGWQEFSRIEQLVKAAPDMVPGWGRRLGSGATAGQSSTTAGQTLITTGQTLTNRNSTADAAAAAGPLPAATEGPAPAVLFLAGQVVCGVCVCVLGVGVGRLGTCLCLCTRARGSRGCVRAHAIAFDVSPCCTCGRGRCAVGCGWCVVFVDADGAVCVCGCMWMVGVGGCGRDGGRSDGGGAGGQAGVLVHVWVRRVCWCICGMRVGCMCGMRVLVGGGVVGAVDGVVWGRGAITWLQLPQPVVSRWLPPPAVAWR